jgi:hypothetical protein
LHYKVIVRAIRENILVIVGGLLLLAANWLAFHDVREPHTVRDWLMLFGTIAVLTRFAGLMWKQKFGPS